MKKALKHCERYLSPEVSVLIPCRWAQGIEASCGYKRKVSVPNFPLGSVSWLDRRAFSSCPFGMPNVTVTRAYGIWLSAASAICLHLYMHHRGGGAITGFSSAKITFGTQQSTLALLPSGELHMRPHGDTPAPCPKPCLVLPVPTPFFIQIVVSLVNFPACEAVPLCMLAHKSDSILQDSCIQVVQILEAKSESADAALDSACLAFLECEAAVKKLEAAAKAQVCHLMPSWTGSLDARDIACMALHFRLLTEGGILSCVLKDYLACGP